MDRSVSDIDCLGVRVRRIKWNDLWLWFAQRLGDRSRCTTVAFANAHTLNLAWVDEEYRNVLNAFDLVLNDGAGIQLYSRLAGKPFPENCNGTDLWPRIFEAASSAGRPLSIYLYGAQPGRAERAAAAIERSHPGVGVVGCHDGYRGDEHGVLRDVERLSPDVLLVARGCPAQEKWIARNRDAIAARVACGVGGLIDFLSAAVPRAPTVLRSLRLEWLYRLRQEPTRLFDRYVVGNPLFVARSLAHLAVARLRSRDEGST